MRFKLYSFIFTSTLLLGVYSCKQKPCKECDTLPTGAIAFTGEWNWIYSVMRSELHVTGGPSYTVRDTVWAEDHGDVALDLSKDGCLRFCVDDEPYWSCVDVVTYELQQPSVFVCRHVMLFNHMGPDLSFESALIIGCDSDTLSGSGIPFNSTSSYYTQPALLPGYELVGFSNHYVSAQ